MKMDKYNTLFHFVL